jgi:Uma2 family endonuclease
MPKTMTDVMTADEFFEWCQRPENRDRWFELERGRIVEVPPPGQRHGGISVNVSYVLSGYIRRQRKGFLSSDAGVIVEHNPDSVKGPDLAYYGISPRYDDVTPKYAETLPTLVVEIISPNDRMSDLHKRITHFHRLGIRLIWVIDPEDRTVMVFRPGEFTEVLTDEEELTGNGVLPDFRCRVAEFFYTTGETDTPPTTS